MRERMVRLSDGRLAIPLGADEAAAMELSAGDGIEGTVIAGTLQVVKVNQFREMSFSDLVSYIAERRVVR